MTTIQSNMHQVQVLPEDRTKLDTMIKRLSEPDLIDFMATLSKRELTLLLVKKNTSLRQRLQREIMRPKQQLPMIKDIRRILNELIS